MADHFSLSTGDCTDSAAKILHVQARIRDTLDDIEQSLTDLQPHWEASESDLYQQIMASWVEGAEGLRSVLTDVRSALLATRDGNSELRAAIQELLNNTT
ncbi:WXG100 family type VII secretion target [Corynebacterium cystitidis]|uniref:WXG100 family type VII secretion target n=1 Tax=Corynebacterium cystitidis TaxID=35757 RepID=UPI00211ED766|nr:hypothetical protein [Corynebacterium cystitidis]